MSIELPQRQQVTLAKSNIVIVCSTYNEKFTTALLTNCLKELTEIAPMVDVELQRVPGAYEVPLMVRRAITKANRKPSAVIALGVILKGSTDHADLIGTAITNELMHTSCETLVPVIHEVLLLENEEQAFARCIASALNRGREAARTAIAMTQAIDKQNEYFLKPSKMSAYEVLEELANPAQSIL